MPMIDVRRSAVRDSFSGRTNGIPPPTAASKYRSRPLASEASKSSRPRVDSSSLFAVTTGFSRSNAARISEPAGSDPPISSHTMSMSGSSTTSMGSAVNAEGWAGTSRRFEGWRSASFETSRRHPARRAMSARWSWSSRVTAVPTVPQPSSPTRSVRSLTPPDLLPMLPRDRWRSQPHRHQYLVLVTVGLLGVADEPSLLDEAEPAVQRDGRLVVRVHAQVYPLHPRVPGPPHGSVQERGAHPSTTPGRGHEHPDRCGVPGGRVLVSPDGDGADDAAT